MKIIITGCSGFVASQLIPLLGQRDVELLLVGRDPERLSALFPGKLVCSYDQIAERGKGFDLLVHLAVINNNSHAPVETFRDVNVRHMLDTSESARRAGVKKFVNISSIHAVDDANLSFYATSKREAAHALREVPVNALTLYLPAITGRKLAGKLAVLNGLPNIIRRPALAMLAALRPTLSVEKLGDYLLGNALLESEQEVILTEGQDNNLFYRSIKRLVDLSFAIAVLLLLWWLMLAIWILIKVQSAGPGIFAQRRIGRDGILFTCYKFRTMKVGTRETATNEIDAGSLTAIGHFLRKSKIDELPQIWNIFRNEISLVGPRPCLPVQTLLIDKRQRRGVFRLKPGITGLAQINHIDMSEPERLARWDQKYCALQSLLLDFRIILATATGRGNGDNISKSI